METLEERYRGDLGLLAFYQKKLLVPGWAGEVDGVEAEYTACELRRRPSLRRVWRVAQFTRKRKAISPAIAKRLVTWCEEIPAATFKNQYSRTVVANKPINMTRRINGIQADFLSALE